jgi:hypothetical protein
VTEAARRCASSSLTAVVEAIVGVPGMVQPEKKMGNLRSVEIDEPAETIGMLRSEHRQDLSGA